MEKIFHCAEGPSVWQLELKSPHLAAIRKELRALRREIEALREAQSRPEGALLTKNEVAARLQVSPRTVDTLAASGELKKIKVRGCVRFSPGAVDAYIRQRAAAGGEGRANG